MTETKWLCLGTRRLFLGGRQVISRMPRSLVTRMYAMTIDNSI